MAPTTLAPDSEETASAAGATTTSRLSAPREEVRIALLDAVANLIQRYGYRKTSVEDIAREAGVSRATVYLYFANKDDLVMAWVEERDRQRLDYLRTGSTTSSGSALQRIAELLLARVLTRFDDAQPYTQGLDEFLAALRPRVLIQRDRHHEAEALLIADILSDGVRKGELAASLSDPLTTARLLILGTNSLLPYNLSARQLGERAEVEARARGLIDLLLCGVRYGSGDKNEAAMPATTDKEPEASCRR